MRLNTILRTILSLAPTFLFTIISDNSIAQTVKAPVVQVREQNNIVSFRVSDIGVGNRNLLLAINRYPDKSAYRRIRVRKISTSTNPQTKQVLLSIPLPPPGRYGATFIVTRPRKNSLLSKEVFFEIAQKVAPTSAPVIEATFTPTQVPTFTSSPTLTPSSTPTITPTSTATSTPVPAGCGNDEGFSKELGYGALYASKPIVDLTTNTPVADINLQSNLQSAVVLPSSPANVSCSLQIPVAYGCYSVEFLFTEMASCVDSSNDRRFLVTSPELGIFNAEVNILRQLGGDHLFYPGAYTAAGPVLDGALNITFEQIALNPIISGFRVNNLVGCSIPTPAPGTPTPDFKVKDIQLDGSAPLPDGITLSCATPTPTPTATATPTPPPAS